MSGTANARRLALRWAPFAVVTLLGLGLVWPAPAGGMPMSRDHMVHLTRIWMVADQLGSGHLRGWSSVWFFGTPVGELYPILGDLLIVAVRATTLGVADWHTAYAVGFSVVFVSQGWAMLRVGRALGLGVAPGLVAAALVLCDAGAYREGGWIYAVDYGVWPQTLSTSLLWLGFGDLALGAQANRASARLSHLGLAALWFAGSLLAHPIAMVAMALGLPLFALCLGLWARNAWRTILIHTIVAAALAAMVAAWWMVPMLSHRAWMSSYGWLWQPLSRMAQWAGHGQITQHMPTAVGACVGLGLGVIALAGGRFARFVGAYAVVVWMFASSDALWTFRLDHISEGFTHLQWQRFLIVAKPGFFLAAGAAIGTLDRLAVRARATTTAAMVYALASGLVVWMTTGQIGAMREHGVGRPQVERVPDAPELAGDYARLAEWLRERWDTRDGFFRVALRAGRNAHWMMDLPVLTGAPTYKLGFTPGDNFVHKPESGQRSLLDALRVRYLISAAGPARAHDQQFGRLVVRDRGPTHRSAAWIRGTGTVEVMVDDPDAGEVRVRVSGADTNAELVFGVAGYPRWMLEHDGVPADWYEAPAVGDGESATKELRRSGALRGGKAGGDDGTEPTLIAARAADGEWVLHYASWRTVDAIGLLLSLLGMAACGGLLAGSGTGEVLESRVVGVMHPAVPAAAIALVLAIAGVRWSRGAAAESGRAFARLAAGDATVAENAHAGPFKTDMLIRPAIVVPRRVPGALVELPAIELPTTVHGWIAIDDDHAKARRKGTRRVKIEVGNDSHGWTVLHDAPVTHHPGRQPLELQTGRSAGARETVRITIAGAGEAPPALGFDLDLGAPS